MGTVDASAPSVESVDTDVDHLLGTPAAGVGIVVSLIVGAAVLIGVMTNSVCAVAVVAVGSLGVALLLGGMDRLGRPRRPGP